MELSSNYRYAFNGKELDNDINSDDYDYGFRTYDARLGRFLSVDPLTAKYAWYTPYQYAGNKPIYAVDVDGLEDDPYSIGRAEASNRKWAEEIRKSDPEHAEERIYEANKNAFLFVGGALTAGNGALASAFIDLVFLHGAYKITKGIVKHDETAVKDGIQSVAFAALSEFGGLVIGKATNAVLKLGKTLSGFGSKATTTVTNTIKGSENFGAEFIDDGLSMSGSGTPSVSRSIRTQSRINIANGRTRLTPLRPSSNQPVSAGFDHVVKEHFNRAVANNRSIFSISEGELKVILQSKEVVNAQVKAIDGGMFVRTADAGKNIGTTSLNQGGTATSRIQVITDQGGNLIAAYPVR